MLQTLCIEKGEDNKQVAFHMEPLRDPGHKCHFQCIGVKAARRVIEIFKISR